MAWRPLSLFFLRYFRILPRVFGTDNVFRFGGIHYESHLKLALQKWMRVSLMQKSTRIEEAPYFTPFAPYVHIAFDYFTPAAVNGGGTHENRGAAIRNF